MVRTAVLPVLLVLLGLDSLLAPPATTQTPVDSSSPKDVVQAFLGAFQGVASCRGVPTFFIFEAKRDCAIPSDPLRSFYDTHLSARSRAQVTQEQFVRFFTENTLRVTVQGEQTPRTIYFSVAFRAALAEPMYAESRDLALVHAVVTIEVRDYTRDEPRPVRRREEPTVEQIVGWLRSMLTRPMGDRPSYFSSVREPDVVEALYLVIKEAPAWKLVLHEPVVRDMQKLPPRSDARVSPFYPVVGQTSIPGEPVILYLMSIVRPAVIDPSSLDEAVLKDFYQRYLSRFNQGQITETDFVAHWKTKARRQWLQGFGDPQFLVNRAIDYTVDEPAYAESRDQARIRATITTRIVVLLSGRTRTDTTTFRVIRDGHTWRLDFPDRVVEEMQPPIPPHVLARWFPNAAVTTGGLTVHVRQVAVERDLTTVTITIANGRDDAASLFLAMAGATLADEHGRLYHTRMLRTTVPDRIAGRSSVTAVATFEAIPVGSKRLALTIPDIQIGNETIAITLPIGLSRP